MDKKNIDNLDTAIIAQLDQFGTQAENIAVIVAQYYRKLIDNNVPFDMAKNLTENFQSDLWYRLLDSGD